MRRDEGFLCFMNRTELQQLAELRLSDAKQLLASEVNDAGAYYLAGYAVECGLKAIIAKNQGMYPYPDFSEESLRRDTGLKKENYFTHSILKLVSTAELAKLLGPVRGADSRFDANWKLIEAWNESARYSVTRSRVDAEAIVNAVEHPTEGVLQWIRNYW
jgi:hypothetical protein